MNAILSFALRFRALLLSGLLVATLGAGLLIPAQVEGESRHDRCAALGMPADCKLPKKSDIAGPSINGAGGGAVAVYTGFTPPASWACGRTWMYWGFTQTYEDNYEFVRYFKANGWGTFSDFGRENEAGLIAILDSTTLGQGDMINIRYDFTGWPTDVTPATMARLRAAINNGLTVVVETEYAFFNSYDPKINQFLASLGTSIRVDQSRDMVHEDPQYQLSSWPGTDYWFHVRRPDGSGFGAVTMATSNLLGGPAAISIYESPHGLSVTVSYSRMVIFAPYSMPLWRMRDISLLKN